MAQRRCLTQVPQQLVQLPDDREHREHLGRDTRRPPPVLSAKGDLGDLLPGAEAVVGGAAGETLRPEAIVNGAAEIRPQVRACRPGFLVDGEVGRGREGRGDTLPQCEAALAVSPQAQPMSAGGRLPRTAVPPGMVKASAATG